MSKYYIKRKTIIETMKKDIETYKKITQEEKEEKTFNDIDYCYACTLAKLNLLTEIYEALKRVK